MTMSAQRVGETRDIEVTTTYGPITNKVREPADHLRYFVSQLQEIIDAIGAEVQV